MRRILLFFALLLLANGTPVAQQPTTATSGKAAQQKRAAPSVAAPSQTKKPQPTAEQKRREQLEQQRREQLKREEEERLFRDRLQVETLLSYARTVPPELAADALLRLADSSKVADRRWKLELLEEAFRNAAQAQHAVKKTHAPGTAIDTRSGYLGNAYRLDLDRLSLQCRIIKSLLALDKTKARRLFTEITLYRLDPLTCDDALGYDVEVFYETATRVLNTAYAPAEIRRQLPIEFARRLVKRLTSPAQVAPAAQFILSLQPTPAQLELLVSDYCEALRAIAGDSRSFFHRLTAPFAAAESLVKACQQKGVPCGEILLALRTYLVNNFTGARCADSYRGDARLDMEARLIRSLFEDLKRYPCVGETEILPLARDDYRPAKVESAAKVFPYWRSAKARALLQRVQKLRWKNNNQPFSEEERLDSDWQYRFSLTLTELTLWSAEDEKSEEDYFHQKSVIYYGLFPIAPAGVAREKLLYDWITFLSGSTLQRSAPLEWFHHVNNLLTQARTARRDERLQILDALKQSNNPVFYLYAEMDLVLASN